MASKILRSAQYAHLPDLLQTASWPFELACELDECFSESEEETSGLQKLLEAKEDFVRTAVPEESL
jgi:hypothetical protein